jgi:hypothetical protein
MPRLWSILVSAAILLVGLLACIPLLHDKERLNRIRLSHQELLQAEEQLARDLEARIDAARNDPLTVERLAREKFGWGRTGEVIFRFRADPNALTPLPSNHPAPPPQRP